MIKPQIEEDGLLTTETGAFLIAAERRRQIEAESYGHAHDDEHVDGELARAAMAYVDAALVAEIRSDVPEVMSGVARAGRWGWPTRWRWAPRRDPLENLVKAGALIAAEIDRLQRTRLSEGLDHDHAIGFCSSWPSCLPRVSGQ